MQEISNPPSDRKAGGLSQLTPEALVEHAGSNDSPPGCLSPEIEALWWDAHGDTEHALQLVEEERSLDAVWVRAYLRRKLGDEAIAAYWYAKAIRARAKGSSVSEREAILKILLAPPKQPRI